MYISEEIREEIKKMVPLLREKQDFLNSKTKTLEDLKQKRNLLSKNIEIIEKQYHLNQVGRSYYESIKDDQEGKIYELDLEILRINIETKQLKLYLQRLSYLYNISKINSEQSSLKIDNNDIQAETMYQMLLKNITTESIEQIRFKQQIIRLIVTYNKNYEDEFSNNESLAMGENLYDLQNKIEELKNNHLDSKEINLSNLSCEELLDANAMELYDKIFNTKKMEKK